MNWYPCGGSGGGSSSGHTYSTTEQIVGTWTDGSTLYEKTCIFTGQFYGNITVGNISVSNLGEIVSIDGSTIANDETSKGLVFAHSNATNNMGIFIRTNGDVEFRSGSAYTASSYVVKFILTIRYTKSS